jgi:hypothetical protein
MTDDNIETMHGLAKRRRVVGKHPALSLPYNSDRSEGESLERAAEDTHLRLLRGSCYE